MGCRRFLRFFVPDNSIKSTRTLVAPGFGLVAPWMAMAVALMLGHVDAKPPKAKEPPVQWTEFVSVEGQPEPVPAQWISTPEGKFAHAIKLPNPVPKDSGYRPDMNPEQYFDHLCKTEAGEFIYKTVENVEGFLFMRPPEPPTDAIMKERYAVEHPWFERTFQLLGQTSLRRARLFVPPPDRPYSFLEWSTGNAGAGKITRVVIADSFPEDRSQTGYRKPLALESHDLMQSRYALAWRGIKRPQDRENNIAGGELIVFDFESREILAVLRTFVISGNTKGVGPLGVFWLNAAQCPQTRQGKGRYIFPTGERVIDFVYAALKSPQPYVAGYR